MGILGRYDPDGTYHPPFDENGEYIPNVVYEQITEDMTKQEFKDECDVNRIVARFEKTGLITHLAKGVPSYADVSQMGNYQEALNTVMAAEDWFMGLPASIRNEWNNDPAQLLDAMHDKDQHPRLIELGILEAAEGAVSPPVPPAPPADPPAPPAPPEPVPPAPAPPA